MDVACTFASVIFSGTVPVRVPTVR